MRVPATQQKLAGSVPLTRELPSLKSSALWCFKAPPATDAPTKLSAPAPRPGTSSHPLRSRPLYLPLRRRQLRLVVLRQPPLVRRVLRLLGLREQRQHSTARAGGVGLQGRGGMHGVAAGWSCAVDPPWQHSHAQQRR